MRQTPVLEDMHLLLMASPTLRVQSSGTIFQLQNRMSSRKKVLAISATMNSKDLVLMGRTTLIETALHSPGLYLLVKLGSTLIPMDLRDDLEVNLEVLPTSINGTPTQETSVSRVAMQQAIKTAGRTPLPTADEIFARHIRQITTMKQGITLVLQQ
jgi:hypothetical protein